MRGGARVPPAAATAAAEAERCPRCGSHNTKFCYYNNYNLAQPRHFCKSCRRYWTLGGTLRNVPVGGSTRRATKLQAASAPAAPSSARRRPTRAPASGSAAASTSSSSSSSSSPPLTSLAVDAAAAAVAPVSGACGTEPVVAHDTASVDAIKSFESLLTEPLPTGFLALGEPFLGGRDDFALGLGLGGGPPEIIDDVGFGVGRAAPAWPFFGDDGGSMVAAGSATAAGGGVDAGRGSWQVVTGGSDEMVAGDAGDCFGWPELAMWSTRPGKGMH